MIRRLRTRMPTDMPAPFDMRKAECSLGYQVLQLAQRAGTPEDVDVTKRALRSLKFSAPEFADAVDVISVVAVKLYLLRLWLFVNEGRTNLEQRRLI